MKGQKQSEAELAETLALRVSRLREARNLTVRDLARLCHFTIRRIEEIEGGIEVWLSITDRSILARALGVQSETLREVEASPDDLKKDRATTAAEQADLDRIADRVLAGEKNIACPRCGAILITAVENALDFEGQPTKFARAYCPVCPFAIR